MRKIVTYPDPVLRKKCEPMTEGPYLKDAEKKEMGWGWVDASGAPINDLVAEVIADMRRVLWESKWGVGLAAPQIGVSMRMFMLAPDRTTDPIVVINPVISDQSGEDTVVEGCLSMPGVEGPVKRPAVITLSGRYPTGEGFSIRAEGLLARVAQHELDHLDGKLFTDRIGMSAKKKVEPMLENLEWKWNRKNSRKK
jgi:peptide deformylase